VSAKYNLTCEQAATFTFQFVIKTDDVAWNLTGYSAVMTIKSFLNSTTSTHVSSIANGEIAVNASIGRLTITIGAVDTTTFDPGKYVYDIVLTAGVGGTVTRILEGKFIVTPGVTI
jgi:hypothetical protein